VHHHQATVYAAAKVQRLLWAANSPDLNAIEPAWPHLKRTTTKKGAPKSKAQGDRRWRQSWKDMEQWRCQAWIERIPRHIQEIIRLEGGNEYKEGAMEKTRRLKRPDNWVDVSDTESTEDIEEQSPSPTPEVVSRKKKHKEHAEAERLGGPDIFKTGRRGC
jgi:hypothetical protein